MVEKLSRMPLHMREGTCAGCGMPEATRICPVVADRDAHVAWQMIYLDTSYELACATLDDLDPDEDGYVHVGYVLCRPCANSINSGEGGRSPFRICSSAAYGRGPVTGNLIPKELGNA
jgi:hypothetical protein